MAELHVVVLAADGETRQVTGLDGLRLAYADRSARIWVDIVDPAGDVLRELGDILGLHPLVVEDIGELNQRAKIELTDDVLHLVMFQLAYVGELVESELDIVITQRFVVTGHSAEVDLRAPGFLRRPAAAYLAQGTDMLLWAITDRLVDDYFPVFDKLSDEVDALGDDVMRRPSGWIVERLFALRRDLLTVRHAVMPQREIFNQLTNRDLPMINAERVIFFRDVYDHLIRLTDELDSQRELVGTTLDLYLSQVNNNLSEVVRRLTAVTVVLAGMGAVAGIFGMSEAGALLDPGRFPGFWIVALVVLAVAVAAVLYFRRIRWL